MPSIKQVPNPFDQTLCALLETITAACRLEPGDERTALIKGLTDLLIYLSNPAVVVDFSKD